MASRIKVDEVTNLAQSGAVAFPTGGANFSGNVAVTGNIDFSGDLLQNGSPFVTLPTQDATNLVQFLGQVVHLEMHTGMLMVEQAPWLVLTKQDIKQDLI